MSMIKTSAPRGLVSPCCSWMEDAWHTRDTGNIEARARPAHGFLLPTPTYIDSIVLGATLRQASVPETKADSGFCRGRRPQKTEASDLAGLSVQIWGIHHLSPTSTRDASLFHCARYYCLRLPHPQPWSTASPLFPPPPSTGPSRLPLLRPRSALPNASIPQSRPSLVALASRLAGET